MSTSMPKLPGKTTVYENIDQNVIKVSEDKARLYLADYQNAVRSWRDWTFPLGMLLTFGITLTAADPKDALFFKAATWEALFFLGFLLSIYWLIKALYHKHQNRYVGDIDVLINKLKGVDNNNIIGNEEEPSNKILTKLKLWGR